MFFLNFADTSGENSSHFSNNKINSVISVMKIMTV